MKLLSVAVAVEMEIHLVVLEVLVEEVLIMQVDMVVLVHLVKEMLEETQTLKEATHTHLAVVVEKVLSVALLQVIHKLDMVEMELVLFLLGQLQHQQAIMDFMLEVVELEFHQVQVIKVVV